MSSSPFSSSSSSEEGTTYQPQERSTDLPVVPPEQNGTGQAYFTHEVFDELGRRSLALDARGVVTSFAYDNATGAMVRRIEDVSPESSLVPESWEVGSGGGADQTTDYHCDAQGRVLRELGPAHEVQLRVDETTVEAAVVRKVNYTVYRDDLHQVWRAAGYARGSSSGYTYVTVGSVRLTLQDEGGRVTDEIEALRASDSGPLAAEETFSRARWRKWTHRIYDAWGRQLAVRVYHLIPENGEGESGYNYNETCYRYDSMGRLNRMKSPGGTITRTVFDVRSLQLGQWVGTNDAGATDNDPTGDGTPGNNMVQTLGNEYDHGEDGGDGLLTKTVHMVDDNPTGDRVTEYTYDYRGRRVDTITTDGVSKFITRNLYDNLDRVLGIDTYHTSVEEGNLTGRTRQYYDNNGRIYRSEIYGVDPENGTSWVALVGEKWYDADGNVVREIEPGSEAITLLTYDNLGRQVMRYLAYAPAAESSSSSHSSSSSSGSSLGSSSNSSGSASSSSSFGSSSSGSSSSGSESSESVWSESSGTTSTSSDSTSSSESSSIAPSSSESQSDETSSESQSFSTESESSFSYEGTSEEGSGGPPIIPPCSACDDNCHNTGQPVRLAFGEIVLEETDLSTRGFVGWVHSRSYGNLLSGEDSGAMGNLWLAMELSSLVFNVGEGNDLIVALRGANNSPWFRPDLAGGWEPMFTERDQLVHDAGAGRYVLTTPEGYRYTYFDDGDGVEAPLQGKLASYADPYGLVINLEYDDEYRMVRLNQSDGFQSNAFVYGYVTSGANAGQMANVTLRVNDVPVRQALYDYYGEDEAFGSVRDLSRVTIREYDATVSAWATIQRTAYRYYVSSGEGGFVHGLKYLLAPESYARMVGAGLDPMSVSDEVLAAYADKFFAYDESRRVAREDVHGGRQTYVFSYELNPDNPGYENYNTWWTRATETRPDGSTLTIYANKAGRTILSKLEDPESRLWFQFYRYNLQGRQDLEALPSAVESVSEPTGLDTTLEVQLYSHEGLVKVKTYYLDTDAPTGAIATYLESEGVQEGTDGAYERSYRLTYAIRAVGGVPIYPVSSRAVFPEAFGPGVVTNFGFTWFESEGSMPSPGALTVAAAGDPDLEDLVVVEQGETTWNEASEQILITLWQRFDDAEGTGPLNGPEGLEPRARRSYVARWYDGIGRFVATADYGTNGGLELERSNVAPARSATVLVSTTHYKDAGEANATVDPNGTETRWRNDAAGRRTRLIENYRTGMAASDPDANRTTDYAYAPDGGLSRLTLVNDVTGDQVTRWQYGTTLADSKVARSDLLHTKFFPSASSVVFACGEVGDGAQRIDYRYNRQGQVVEMRDPNGTVHAYDFDLLGRQTQDRVTVLGTGIDGIVRRIETGYDVKRLLKARVTSYDAPEAGEGTVVNEVAFEYDAMRLMKADRQAHAGAVGPETPSVDYQNASGHRNSARREYMVYPDNARVLEYLYGPEEGAGDRLSRVEGLKIAGESEPVCRYIYMGTARCVEIAYLQPEVRLSYRKPAGAPDGDAGDPYNGYDRFGRTVDMRWVQGAGDGGVLDRIQYGYDPAGNRTWRRNFAALSGGQDQAWTYDGLYQVKTGALGTLNIGLTAIGGVPASNESWSYDPTGNWRRWQAAEAGLPSLDQTRVNNRDNQITQIDGSCEGIAHDLAGNMTLIPPDAEGIWSSPQALKWDAWNRLVAVRVPGGATAAQYAYDGLWRRTVKLAAGEARHYYYNDQWKCLEERTATAPASSSSASEVPESSSESSSSDSSSEGPISSSSVSQSSSSESQSVSSSTSHEEFSASSISSLSSDSSSSSYIYISYSSEPSSSSDGPTEPLLYYACNEEGAGDDLINTGIEETNYADFQPGGSTTPEPAYGKCQGGRKLNGVEGGWFTITDEDGLAYFNPGGSAPLYISLWFRTDKMTGRQVIMLKDKEYQLLFDADAGELIFRVATGSGSGWNVSAQVGIVGEVGFWHQVLVWIIPSVEIGLSRNAGAPGTAALAFGQSAFDGGNPIYLGYLPETSSSISELSSYSSESESSSSEDPLSPLEGFDGVIDEMAVFHTAVSSSVLYNMGAGLFYRSGSWGACPGGGGMFAPLMAGGGDILAFTSLATLVDCQYVWGARSGHRDELVLRERAVSGSSSSSSESSGGAERLWCLMDYYDPTAVVDNMGEVAERYRFSTFGLRTVLAPDFTPRLESDYGWDFAFKGQFLDLETGYYGYGYRYYSPSLGRWLSRDPIAEATFLESYLQTKSRDELRHLEGKFLESGYEFVKNNPINGFDYVGLYDTGLISGLGIAIYTSRANRGSASEFLHFFHVPSISAVDLTTSGSISTCKDKYLRVMVVNSPYSVTGMLYIYGDKPIALGGADLAAGGREYPAVTTYSESSPDVKGPELWRPLLNPASGARTVTYDYVIAVERCQWKAGGTADVVIKYGSYRWSRSIPITT